MVKLVNDVATSAVNNGIDPDDVAAAVENAIRTNAFWILTHERVALRTTEQRLEWMKGGRPLMVDLEAATKAK
jgi:hypothetical protein